jgi:carboxyl-terminal processing protease
MDIRFNRPARLALSFAFAVGLGLTGAPAALAQGAGAGTAAQGTERVPAAGAPKSVDAWSDALWDAARTGNRATVDMLLENVPDGQASASIEKLRAAVAMRDRHSAESAEAVRALRAEKLAEMKAAMAADQTAKALVAAAYLKYLADDWKTQVESKDIQDLVAHARARADAARAAEDWVFAEDLYTRIRTLYEGTPLKQQYQVYDDLLETDVSPRVNLVLEYAPRTWHRLRKAQYERLDPKDRKRPFPEFSEKGAQDWKSQLEGLTEPMLGEALAQIAAQHLENVGWKPLLQGGLNMVRLLATTSALKENFGSLGDAKVAGAFEDAVKAQMKAVDALRPAEVDARTFARVMAALRKANDETVRLPFEAIIREFGNGAIATMAHDYEDPYTEIVWPDRIRRFNQAIKGNFVGVGVLIRHNDNREITIVNPLDGSPARRAGIKPGDKIVAVNGVSTADWALDRAVESITGPAGSTVTLTISRDGEPGTQDVPLVRQKIKIYSVQGWKKRGYNDRSEPQWDWFIDPEAGLGYVRLTSFNEDTWQDFLRAMHEMASTGPLNGLILDLRGNPGGLMNSAVSVVNAFMREGRIVSVENRFGRELYSQSASAARAPLADVPTVVLINEGSASASEIVSGALEANDVAVVVGERSFGKGSVQEVHPIVGPSGSAEATVKFTVQHYLLPPKPGEAKGRLVHKRPGAEDWGVVPDYTVRLTPVQMEEINKIRASADDVPEDPLDDAGAAPEPGEPAIKAPREKRDPAELIDKGVDPQLQTALIILQGRALKTAARAAAAGRTTTPAAGPAKAAAGKTRT